MSPGVQYGEHAVALQVDDLLGLRDSKGNRAILAVMRIGPNEPVLFRTMGKFFSMIPAVWYCLSVRYGVGRMR